MSSLLNFLELKWVSLSVLVKGLLSYSGDESSIKSYVKEMNRVALEAPERSGGLCFFSLFACMKSLQQRCVKKNRILLFIIIAKETTNCCSL
jgi:hypothetical protein